MTSLSVKIPEINKPRIVIIGGGFGGIQVANKLRRKGFQIVLLDRNNYHTFQPLLYQVATAGLEPDSIAGPLRKQFDNHDDFHFRMLEVLEINPEESKVITSVGDLSYDYLVIAAGSKTNYFGNNTLEKNVFPLKKVTQALDLRSHILQNFEKSVLTSDPKELKSLMNFVVVGGGPTGVELSGALAELKNHVLPRDYPELEFDKMQIHLVEGTTRLLNGMSDFAGDKSLKYLKNLGVQVSLGTLVQSYEDNQAILSNGDKILSQTVIWAAGVKGNLIKGVEEANAIKQTRLVVDEFNKLNGFDNIYAIGDIALMETEAYPKGHPMVAQVAIQQGQRLAKNFIKMSLEKPLAPFKYKDKGSMATIGRNKAVADLPVASFGGLMAWLIWMFIHLISLIGFRNKLVTFNNWVWSYFTYDRGTRLIIRKFSKPQATKKTEELTPQ